HDRKDDHQQQDQRGPDLDPPHGGPQRRLRRGRGVRQLGQQVQRGLRRQRLLRRPLRLGLRQGGRGVGGRRGRRDGPQGGGGVGDRRLAEAGIVERLERDELAGPLGGGLGGLGRPGGLGRLGGVGGVGGLAPGPVVLAGSGALAGPVGLVGLAGLFGRVGRVGRVGPGGRLRRVAQLEHRGGLVEGPLGGPERGEHGGGLVDGALAAAGLVPALGLSAVVVPAVLSVLSVLAVLVGAGRAVVVPVVPVLAVLPVLPVLAVGVGRVVGGGRGRDIAVVGGVRCVLGRVRGPGGGRGGLGSVLGRRDHVGVGPVGGSVV